MVDIAGKSITGAVCFFRENGSSPSSGRDEVHWSESSRASCPTTSDLTGFRFLCFFFGGRVVIFSGRVLTNTAVMSGWRLQDYFMYLLACWGLGYQLIMYNPDAAMEVGGGGRRRRVEEKVLGFLWEKFYVFSKCGGKESLTQEDIDPCLHQKEVTQTFFNERF
ncbi:uncharacterized protein LOC118480885 [Helianthus annuus]|uniref:uncharacterized protein LOC118480885 n=1 Tax=Helianthus annuus TaxID=4232 RepID=UPI001652C9B6|nr:uncharacterized protein LOC118480885 [Helianthus annuus]